MTIRRVHHEMSRHRGTVLIMVVGVLSMLFIVGATLLIVARFERSNVRGRAAARNIAVVGAAVAEPAISQLREDAVGKDGVPYNRPWNADPATGGTETSRFEDFADFPGFWGSNSLRSGDLLLSSIEPYLTMDGTERRWRLFAGTWIADTFVGSFRPATHEVRDFEVSQISRPQDGDADGDGIRDTATPSFLGDQTRILGSSYETRLRVVPHGGMVLLDWLTPPSLLAQVIHPQDNPYHDQPLRLWTESTPLLTDAKDEARLRRRFMLAGSLPTGPGGGALRPDEAFDPQDMRYKLPITLGYQAPTGASAAFRNMTPHWWPAHPADPPVRGDEAWWEVRIRPGPPLNHVSTGPGDPSYSAASDLYDRRRLLTTVSSDDILRPQRDERRIRESGGSATVFGALYYVLNPDSSAPPQDVFGFDRLPAHAYGRDSGGGLVFNAPGLRTQFSLRDALVDPAAPGNNGFQASYERAVQLTAYFLAMLQRTIPAVSDAERLSMAAQLAVNTIDFADNGDSTGDGTVDGIDPVSYFAWPPGPTSQVHVYGVEKQPFLTEVYANVVSVYVADPGDPGAFIKDEVASEGQSIYAVELYNPYDVRVDLTEVVLKVDSAVWTLGSKTHMEAYEVAVFANNLIDLTQTNRPFLTGSGITEIPGLKFTPGQPIELCLTPNRVLDLRDGSAGTTTRNLVIDRIDPTEALVIPGRFEGGGSSFAKPVDDDIDSPTEPATYWRHTSIQRYKEPNTNKPIYWRFTLAREAGFESPIYKSGEPAESQPPIHGLRGGDDPVLIGPNDPVCKPADEPDCGLFFDDLAPFPIVAADRGVDPTTKGCRAFPTTGSLLLTTRYSHSWDGASDSNTPVTVAATQVPAGVARTRIQQMTVIDNGHMPVWDSDQRAGDLEAGRSRLSVPWGQMVFDYFTALPLEELLALPTDPGVYKWDYDQWFGLYDTPGNVETRRTGLPLVSRLEGVPSAFGPRVEGRININVAPWWVLDGLPVLPDGMVGTTAATPTNSQHPLAGVPVLEVTSNQLDPWDDRYNPASPLFEHSPVGWEFVNVLLDTPSGPNPPARFLDISPTLAKYMVSYRENRPIVNPATGSIEAYAGKDGDDPPGFVSVGELVSLMDSVQITVATRENLVGTPQPTTIQRTLRDLRSHGYEQVFGDPSTLIRPYSYVGYLQLLAPVVRMQDWATVRNHVYTLYSVVGDTSTEPPLWLRSQVTVDRTRCLYSQDLPLRIAETPPTGYYNVVGD